MDEPIAEFHRTYWLVQGGCGGAVFAAAFPDVRFGLLGVSRAFGSTVQTLACAAGRIRGRHLDPAVTVGLFAAGRFGPGGVLPRVAAQVLGGRARAGVLCVIATGRAGFDAAACSDSIGFGEHSPGGYSMQAASATEVVTTAFLLFIVLGATDRLTPAGLAPIVGGGLGAVADRVTRPASDDARRGRGPGPEARRLPARQVLRSQVQPVGRVVPRRQRPRRRRFGLHSHPPLELGVLGEQEIVRDRRQR